MCTNIRLSKFSILVLIMFIASCSKQSDEKVSKTQVLEESPGQILVKQNCKVCHAQGINGAPIIGNKKMWAPRLQQGVPTLVEHAINGFGLMPAKGGKTHLTDEEIKLAVDYMVSQVQ